MERTNYTISLLDYFKDVYALESQLFSYQQATKKSREEINLCRERINQKCIPLGRGYWTPYQTLLDDLSTPNWSNEQKLPPDVYQKYKERYSEKNSSSDGVIGVLIEHPIIYTIIIALILSTIIFFISGKFLFVPVFIITIILVVLSFVLWSHKDKKELKRMAKIQKECLDEQLPIYMQQYKNTIDAINTEIETNIQPQEQHTKDLLQYIYSMDVIHPKYRNFLAVAQIYEYLDTGRCTELTGPNGAYNLYEQELRQNIIIDKLDQIINQLDRLNRTMGYVASAITQSNRLLGDISSSLGRIEANTALTAYNTQCIANNTSIANRYNYR